jgi:hypothetical protein
MERRSICRYAIVDGAVLAAAVAAASALALVAFPTLKERLLLHATGTAAVDAATTATASTSAATFAALDAGQWPADARVRFSDWSSIGADALPNAVVSVVAAGDRMYAMGEVGSIYESTDEAASWHQVAFVTQKQYPAADHEAAGRAAGHRKPAGRVLSPSMARARLRSTESLVVKRNRSCWAIRTSHGKARCGGSR